MEDSRKRKRRDYFATLPEDCISDILSLTSPEDTARLSAVSKGFKAAADSDSVWNRFLPPDLTYIISRSASPVVYSDNRELYFSLCNSSILLDDGSKLSFSLDKRSGKKCFMIAAKELNIAWGDDRHRWEWKSYRDSRFSSVASLRSVCWLDIRGKIATNMLSARTNYAAYLVYRLSDNPHGLESAKSLVRFVRRESDEEAENRAKLVTLCGRIVSKRRGLLGTFERVRGGSSSSTQTSDEIRRDDRSDGWMEVILGSFYNVGGDGGDDVEARITDEIWELDGKSGLIVEGIEFRPNRKKMKNQS